ncbi:MAG: long-chain fatty acid--CoA ligase [Chloroflexota bacterium]|nr:long-chain fatty acid--CoA ligase [Chloroflexota bacterium]
MVTYMDRPWISKLDPGVSPSLMPYPDKPLFALLRERAARTPDNIAVSTSARLPIVGRMCADLTYAEVDRASDALAVALAELGVKKGDRVGVVMPNTAAFIISYFGILKAGAIVVAVNPTYPPEKMREQLADSGATVALCLTLFYNALKSVQAGTQVRTIITSNVKEYLHPLARRMFQIAKEKKGGHVIEAVAPGDHWLQAVLSKYAGRKPTVTVSGEDVAIYQYTGGTTGVPKGAMSQHKALVANTLQCIEMLTSGDDKGRGDKEIFLGAIPFFHVYGLITVVGFAMSLGARIVLVPNARDIPDVLDVIDTYKPTIFMGVPALYNAISNHPKVKAKQIDMTSIRVCMSGSAPLPPAVKREFERLTGGKLLEGFGMSEMPTATHTNPLVGENRTGSIGLPFPDMDVRVVDLETGTTEIAVGEIGELIMHGPQLMLGYHNMPDETAHALRLHDGKRFLYTGDIARMDEDGYFYIVDRKKDMAIIGGYNVFPLNVDKVLADHPAVLEVATAAVPHPDKQGQEALKAWVVLKPDMTVTESELVDFASKRLARYEVPSRFSFIETLPKTTVGKTLRRELVAMEIAERTERARTLQPTP